MKLDKSQLIDAINKFNLTLSELDNSLSISEDIKTIEDLNSQICKNQHYSAIWVDKKEIDKLRSLIPNHEKDVSEGDGYHITLAYKPQLDEALPVNLIGQNVELIATHIIDGDGISGIKVDIPDSVKQFYHGAKNSHITVCYDNGHFPVETGRISESQWIKLEEPIEIQGKLGFMSLNHDVFSEDFEKNEEKDNELTIE